MTVAPKAHCCQKLKLLTFLLGCGLGATAGRLPLAADALRCRWLALPFSEPAGALMLATTDPLAVVLFAGMGCLLEALATLLLLATFATGVLVRALLTELLSAELFGPFVTGLAVTPLAPLDVLRAASAAAAPLVTLERVPAAAALFAGLAPAIFCTALVKGSLFWELVTEEEGPLLMDDRSGPLPKDFLAATSSGFDTLEESLAGVLGPFLKAFKAADPPLAAVVLAAGALLEVLDLLSAKDEKNSFLAAEPVDADGSVLVPSAKEGFSFALKGWPLEAGGREGTGGAFGKSTAVGLLNVLSIPLKTLLMQSLRSDRSLKP